MNNENNGWISVKDQLPGRKGLYLTFCRYRNGDTRQTIKLWMDNQFTSEMSAVQYWRELPADPEEDPYA